MTTIRVKENEPFDVALSPFKRTIEKLGLPTDLRSRAFHEKPPPQPPRTKATPHNSPPTRRSAQQ